MKLWTSYKLKVWKIANNIFVNDFYFIDPDQEQSYLIRGNGNRAKALFISQKINFIKISFIFFKIIR